MFYISKYSKFILNYLSVLFLFFFLYLWDIQIANTQINIKFFAIIFTPYLLFKYFSLKNKKIIILFSLILFHKIYLDYLNNFNFILHDYFKLLILFVFILFFIETYKYFLKDLEKFIFTFILFIILYFITFVIFKDLNQKFILSCYNGFISQNNFLFKENSHFGFTFIGIFFYSIYQLFYKDISFVKKIIYTLFCIIIFINYSASFIFSSLLISFFSLIYLLKNKKKILPFLIILTLSVFIILFDKQCNNRLVGTLNSIKIIIVDKYLITKKNNILTSTNSEEANITNLSSVIYVNSFLVLNEIFSDYPFGVGFDNLKSYFKTKSSITKKKFNKLYWRNIDLLNNHDGTNNFVKLNAEYGLMILVIFYFLIKFILNKNISFELKLLLLSPFLVQFFFRGAGYFNGGFAFYLTVMIILSTKQNKFI